jgi:hypothetical protein
VTTRGALPSRLRRVPSQRRGAQSRPFEIIPLFDVFIEVVMDPKIVEDWPFSGWDGGDLGHTWLIKVCKQETCK